MMVKHLQMITEVGPRIVGGTVTSAAKARATTAVVVVVASKETIATGTMGNAMVIMTDTVTTIVAAMTEEIGIGILIRINRLDQFWVSEGDFFFDDGTVRGISYFKLILLHGFISLYFFVDHFDVCICSRVSLAMRL